MFNNLFFDTIKDVFPMLVADDDVVEKTFTPYIGDIPNAPCIGDFPDSGNGTAVKRYDYSNPPVLISNRWNYSTWKDTKPNTALPKIRNVVFNPPATIVFWEDGTKTVVKCQPRDTYSKEIGLAMAICKKALGNKGNYNDVFNKWLSK
jgi:hypothetical protein